MKRSVNIYDFKDPILYLEACFQLHKNSDPEFSLRKWASQLGINSSDALFKVLGRKKNLSLNLVTELASGLGLSSSEETYFEFMTKYSQANTIREKNIFEMVLAELGGAKGSRTFLEDDGLFSHWANLAILSFCNLKMECTREKIHSLFLDDISPDVVNQGIDQLLKLNLLREDEQGRLRRNYNHEMTKDDQPRAAVHAYYEQVFDLAKKRIPLPLEDREFQTSLMAIKSNQLPVFKEMIRHFKAKLGELSLTEDGDQVYLLNIQFFPMSKKIAAEESNSRGKTSLVSELRW